MWNFLSLKAVQLQFESTKLTYVESVTNAMLILNHYAILVW